MSNKIKIAPSILSCDFSKLGEEIQDVQDAGADMIHVDVMDGAFVPNITIGPCVVSSIKKFKKVPFDVHLMIDKPRDYIQQFTDAGADIITFHIEACKDPRRTIDQIHDSGLKAGISIKPNTLLSEISPLFDEIEMVLIMTVEPGFGGQSFIKDMLAKIEGLKRIYTGDIQVDGGINENTAKKVIKAGANILVAGTAVFGEENYKNAIRRLRGE